MTHLRGGAHRAIRSRLIRAVFAEGSADVALGLSPGRIGVAALELAAMLGLIVKRERPARSGAGGSADSHSIGRAPAQLRSALRAARGETSTIAGEPLYWPPAKIVVGYLAHVLGRSATIVQKPPGNLTGVIPIEMETRRRRAPLWH